MGVIRPATDQAIDDAAAILRRGGLIGMPTETVYGLAGVATDVNAVAAIFAAKQRPAFNPLIVHVHSPTSLDAYVRHVPDPAAALIDRFWPGPLTVVLPKTDVIDDLITAALPTVAVRCPDHPVARKLIERTGRPLAAPSANRYMHVSPTSAQHVLDLGDAVEMILDAGPCQTGIESTVIGFDEADRPVLLRRGGLPVEDIEQIAGPVALPAADHPATAARPSPGMTRRHYAPRTPLKLIEPEELAAGHDVEPTATALLLFSAQHEPPNAAAYHTTVCLTDSDDTRQAATRLFLAMRELDQCGASLILATLAPPTGLGAAINDRLTRAAAQ
jgi:L-threonylcarbamoyladenylate synthase